MWPILALVVGTVAAIVTAKTTGEPEAAAIVTLLFGLRQVSMAFMSL
ncbi:MAG: hypothetical protein ACO1NY_05130 [Pseudorhodoplanes sp.]